MNTARAEIPSRERVVTGELVLDPKVPLNGIRQLLVGNISRSRRAGVGLGKRAGLCIRSDSSVCEEIRPQTIRIKAEQVNGCTELGRKIENADVVVQHVIVHSKSGADGCLATRARRVGDADSRSKVLVLRLRLIEAEETWLIRNRIKCLQPGGIRHAREFPAKA